jgi:hypothetical protein
VVYSKPPFGGPEQVLKHLSRYTHRVAISNRRILAVGNGSVRFEYRDYADNNQRKELSLPAAEFLRFLLHVLPTGFMRLRHYGITANCQRRSKLARCRELLAPSTPPAVAESNTPSDAAPTADDDHAAIRCPVCGGGMRVIQTLTPTACSYDTS